MSAYLKLIPIALLAFSVSAQAAVTITIEEKDGNVVVTGDGAIDSVSGLLFYKGQWGTDTFINPSLGNLLATTQSLDHWRGFTGPQSFGNGARMDAASATVSGQGFGFLNIDSAGGNILGLPSSYEVGQAIDFTMTFPEQTLNSLGIRSGEYRWIWGAAQDGESGDSIIMNVIPPVVAPATAYPVPGLGAFGLMGLAGVIGAAGVAMTRRRKQS